jgi:hypothetical protein
MEEIERITTLKAKTEGVRPKFCYISLFLPIEGILLILISGCFQGQFG